jgi:S1-C subfamily serine protease
LKATAPYDRQGPWETRLNALDFKSLTGGLEASGYDYVYQRTMIPVEASFIKSSHLVEIKHALGFQTMPDGTVEDVWVGGPAYIAGLGPDDKLIEVNGKPYTAELLTMAVRDSPSNTGPIVLTASRDDETGRPFAVAVFSA